MRRGRISYSKVRAVTRVATPENEQRLLDVALAGTAEHVEQIARSWRRVDRAAEQAEEQRQDRNRSLRTWVADDGMVVLRGRLTPEVGADAAEEQPTLAQRQADAIGMLAESALAGGLDRGTAGDRYQVVLHVDAEALTEPRDVPAGTSAGAAAGPAQQNPGRYAPAERSAGAAAPGWEMPGNYVPAGTPDGDAGQSGAEPRRDGSRWRRTDGPCPDARRTPAASAASSSRAAPPDGSQTVLEEAGGIHVSAETARRVACDAAAVLMPHGPGGEILDVGRRTHTVSPALRRALAARDRQCRFPGCGNRRCDAHHVEHWADGGRTALDNLVLLCRRHHRAVHEEGFRITRDDAGGVQFVRPDGWPLPAAPPAPDWAGEALGPTNEQLAAEGVAIDARTATPAWDGQRLDLDWIISVLWRPRRTE